MMKDVGCRRSAVEIEAELQGGVTKRVGKTWLCWKNPGPGGIVSTSESKSPFGDIEMEGCKAVARFE